MNLFSLVLGIALVCVCGTARAVERTIAYDDGSAAKTTVLGWFAPEQKDYMLGTEFSLHWTEDIVRSTLLVHVHVGSQLKTVTSDGEPKLLVTVNEDTKIEKPLADLKPDANQWVEIEVPPGAWKIGVNRVQVSSNVNNTGNMTSESVGILASVNPPFLGRSWYTVDGGKERRRQRDRNLGIRLRLEEKAPSGARGKLTLTADTTTATLNQPIQIIAAVAHTAENAVNPGRLEWSTNGGTIDDGGWLVPSRTGDIEVRARAGAMTDVTIVSVTLKPPFGIEPPDSAKRLGSQPPPPNGISLSGKWDFATDPENRGIAEGWFDEDSAERWSEIVVPGSWQAQGFGLDYHGVGWYRREFTVPPDWSGRRTWVRFAAAATSTTVWLNGQRVGHHLGNWVPFEFDLTRYLKEGPNRLVVQVDELPEHFSAGFAREVGRFVGTDSHFGGLWQDVTLFHTGKAHIVSAYVVPDLRKETAEVRVELIARTPKELWVFATVEDADGREVVRREARHMMALPVDSDWTHPEELRIALPIPDVRTWSPDDPYLYKFRVEVYEDQDVADRYEHRFGMRSVERKGHQILLNGQPIYVRGILHWAYYPDLFSIDPGEETIRKEFAELRASGFNMVKPCLLMFPPRFYEIADETGMLIWQEYPTWLYLNFPKEGDERLRPHFEREYPQWFRFDRKYTSVILRDLTCEAHEGSNWDLLKDTYKVAKEMTGGALICDNSSFLHHAITDWFDCHTYRDIDQFHAYVEDLVTTMQQVGLPYLTGEDYDADTYRDSAAIRDAFMQEQTPWWLANDNFQSQLKFDEELRDTIGPDAPFKLVKAQTQHGLTLRKAYLEEMRLHPELSGYIMTHIRDITVTRPGFYDDLGKQKHTPDEWKAINADRVLAFRASRRAHTFPGDETVSGDLVLSNFGPEISGGSVSWKLVNGETIIAEGSDYVEAPRGSVQVLRQFMIRLPADLRETNKPIRCELRAESKDIAEPFANSWPVWIFPSEAGGHASEWPKLYGYSASNTDGFITSLRGLDVSPFTGTVVPEGSLLLTNAWDDKVQQFVTGGGRALLVSTGNRTPGLNQAEAPFWREMTIWLPKEHGALGDFPHEEFVGLQFYDLTTRHPFTFKKEERAEITPIVWGTNARHPGAQLYDYLFEKKHGQGKLVACSLNLLGNENVAGDYMLRNLIRYASAPE